LETIFWVKILKFFEADADPRSGTLFDPWSGMEIMWIQDKHPGSTTLSETVIIDESYLWAPLCPGPGRWGSRPSSHTPPAPSSSHRAPVIKTMDDEF
jgi:hypothetical protein